MTTRMIYKICPKEAWDAARESGSFTGMPVDIEDGYIHFSAASQVAETAEKHFSGQDDLVLVAVDAARFGGALKWEPSRGGDLFPHLYGSFPVSLAAWVKPLPRDAKGVHIFPDGVLP